MSLATKQWGSGKYQPFPAPHPVAVTRGIKREAEEQMGQDRGQGSLLLTGECCIF